MSKRKIDIYVGHVGGAYIDKTTAQTNYDKAHQNVLDTETIVEKANTLKNIILGKIATSTTVYNEAVTLGIQLENLIAQNSSNASKYRKLKEIQSDLIANDTDNDYTNGGNKVTSQLNLVNANAQLNKIEAIIADAETLLEDYRKLELTYEIKLNTSNDELNQYIVNKGSSNISENESTSFDGRMNEITSNINVINDTNTAVSQTTNDTLNQINEVLNESDPETPIVVANKYVYIGHNPILNNEQNFTVTDDMTTDDTVDNWHKLEFNYNNGENDYFVKGIDSLSLNKNWYIIMPKNPVLTPVMSDLQGTDTRFTPSHDVYVNDEPYTLYIVSNDVVEIINNTISRLNVILKLNKSGETVDPEPEPQVEPALGYFYIGNNIPTSFAINDIENNLAVTGRMGWRKIENAFNTYDEGHPLFNGAISVSTTGLPERYYVILPQGFIVKDAGGLLIFTTPLSTQVINDITYNVYSGANLSFFGTIYYSAGSNVEPEPHNPEPGNNDIYWYAGKVKPTNQTVITDDLAEDATSTGWHLIPNALNTYNENNPIFNGASNAIVIDEDYIDVDHYIAIPNGTSIHALLGEPNYSVDSTITINGNTYTVYASTVPNSEFAYIIY